MVELITAVLAFLVGVSILVVFHEFGHYLVARWCGVAVLRFSIGLGKPIWRKKFPGSGTEWVVSWLPLGGYVHMLQADMLSCNASEELKAATFDSKPLPQRTLIVLAGPAFNLILAALLFAGAMMLGTPSIRATVAEVLPGSPAAVAGLRSGHEITAVERLPMRDGLIQFNQEILQHVLDGKEEIAITVGAGDIGMEKVMRLDGVDIDAAARGNLPLQIGLIPQLPAQMAVIGETLPDHPAEAAVISDSSVGLRRGDRIVSVDGQTCYSWQCLSEKIDAHAGEMLELGLLRDGSLLVATVRPMLMEVGDGGTTAAVIGVRPLPEDKGRLRGLYYTMSHPPLESLLRGVEKTFDISVLSLKLLWNVVSGDVSTKALNGPVAIAYYSGKVATSGLAMILTFLGIISVGLGIFNLLPLPMLDGGYLVYFLIEWVRGSPLPDTVQRYVQLAGLAILVGFFVLVTYNDFRFVLP